MRERPEAGPLPEVRTGLSARKQYLLLWSIVGLGLILRLWNINWGLPELYEEAIPLRYSLKLWTIGTRGIDQQFFVYPALTYYIQFLIQGCYYLGGHLVGVFPTVESFLKAYEANPSTLAILARLTTILFDLGTIVIVYQMLKAIGERRAGLVAAFLLSVNFLHIKESHLINVDVPATFFVSLSIFMFLRVLRRGHLKSYLLSGAAIGMAAASKYNAAVLIIVLILVHLLRATSLSRAIKSIWSLPLLASLALSGAVFFLVNPLILTHLDDFRRRFMGLEAMVGSVNLGMNPNTSSASYYLFDCLPSNLGVVLSVAALISVGYLLFKKRREYYLLLCAFAVYFVTTVSWGARAERYILPLIPIVVSIAAIGLSKLYEKLSDLTRHKTLRHLKTGGNSPAIGMIFLLGLIVLEPSIDMLAFERSYSLPDTRTITKQWILEHVQKGSAIAVGFYGLELPANSYLLMPLQYMAEESEKMAPFYDARWYEDLDLVIASDYDYGRYRLEPLRFAEILQFYDTLRARWTLVNEVDPGSASRGPTFWLYRSPPPRRMLFDADLLERLTRVEDPHRVIGFLGKLGIILFNKGRLEKSEQLFSILTAIDPTNFEAHEKLAEAEFGLKQFEAASNEIDTCLRLGGEQADLYILRGRICLASGEYDGAALSFKNALRIDNHRNVAYEQLMLVYAYQNREKEILETLVEYRKILADGSAKARLVDQQIEKLKSGK